MQWLESKVPHTRRPADSRGVGAQPRVSEHSEDPGCFPNPFAARNEAEGVS
jgi:hypothetical protein